MRVRSHTSGIELFIRCKPVVYCLTHNHLKESFIHRLPIYGVAPQCRLTQQVIYMVSQHSFCQIHTMPRCLYFDKYCAIRSTRSTQCSAVYFDKYCAIRSTRSTQCSAVYISTNIAPFVPPDPDNATLFIFRQILRHSFHQIHTMQRCLYFTKYCAIRFTRSTQCQVVYISTNIAPFIPQDPHNAALFILRHSFHQIHTMQRCLYFTKYCAIRSTRSTQCHVVCISANIALFVPPDPHNAALSRLYFDKYCAIRSTR